MNTIPNDFRNFILVILALLGLIIVINVPGHVSSAAAPEALLSASHSSLTDRQASKMTQLEKSEMTARWEQAYGKLPLSFEANRGQADAQVKFLSRYNGSTLFLTATESVLVLHPPRATQEGQRNWSARPITKASVFRMKMLGANPGVLVTGLDQLSGDSNYFNGQDSNRWHTNIPNYARVRYQTIYPGIDLFYYGNQRQLEYDFVIAPGAEPQAIHLAFAGVKQMKLDASGDLLFHTPGGEVRMQKPFAYQEVDGIRKVVACHYVRKGKHQIGFRVEAYDQSKPLIIDPVLSYSTFLGGNSFEEGRTIAIDANGNAYVAGRTQSFNFPITIDAYDTTYANSTDVFVTKMNAQGSALVYSTYLGGNSDESAYGIVIDSSGNAYITGYTTSTGYPTTPGAFQTTLAGGFQGDAFVTKLNSTGTALLYSTYLGGNSGEQAYGIALDTSGNAYVAGSTSSSNFPTISGSFQTTLAGGQSDAFVTKLNSTGTSLVYSTYLGGSLTETATGIKVDSSNNAYVTGNTASTNFPVTSGAIQTT